MSTINVTRRVFPSSAAPGALLWHCHDQPTRRPSIPRTLWRGRSAIVPRRRPPGAATMNDLLFFHRSQRLRLGTQSQDARRTVAYKRPIAPGRHQHQPTIPSHMCAVFAQPAAGCTRTDQYTSCINDGRIRTGKWVCDADVQVSNL